MGSNDEPLHPSDVQLPLQYLEGHVRCEPHLRVMWRGSCDQPSGVNGGLRVRLSRKLLQQSNCNSTLQAMRLDRRYEPSRLNERCGLCLRHWLHSQCGFVPTLRFANKLDESRYDWG